MCLSPAAVRTSSLSWHTSQMRSSAHSITHTWTTHSQAPHAGLRQRTLRCETCAACRSVAGDFWLRGACSRPVALSTSGSRPGAVSAQGSIVLLPSIQPSARPFGKGGGFTAPIRCCRLRLLVNTSLGCGGRCSAVAFVTVPAPAIPTHDTIQRTPRETVAARLAEAVADEFDHARGQAHAVSLAHRAVRVVDPLAVHEVARGAAYILVADLSGRRGAGSAPASCSG